MAIDQRERVARISNAAAAEKLGKAWGKVPPEPILQAVREIIADGWSRVPVEAFAGAQDSEVRAAFMDAIYPRIAGALADVLREAGNARGRSGGLAS